MPDREDTEYATSSPSEKLIVALNFFLEASFFRKCLSCTNRLIKKKKKREVMAIAYQDMVAMVALRSKQRGIEWTKRC